MMRPKQRQASRRPRDEQGFSKIASGGSDFAYAGRTYYPEKDEIFGEELHVVRIISGPLNFADKVASGLYVAKIVHSTESGGWIDGEDVYVRSRFGEMLNTYEIYLAVEENTIGVSNDTSGFTRIFKAISNGHSVLAKVTGNYSYGGETVYAWKAVRYAEPSNWASPVLATEDLYEFGDNTAKQPAFNRTSEAIATNDIVTLRPAFGDPPVSMYISLETPTDGKTIGETHRIGFNNLILDSGSRPGTQGSFTVTFKKPNGTFTSIGYFAPQSSAATIRDAIGTYVGITVTVAKDTNGDFLVTYLDYDSHDLPVPDASYLVPMRTWVITNRLGTEPNRLTVQTINEAGTVTSTATQVKSLGFQYMSVLATSTNLVNLTIDVASHVTSGIVSQAAQWFAGNKYFKDNAFFGVDGTFPSFPTTHYGGSLTSTVSVTAQGSTDCAAFMRDWSAANSTIGALNGSDYREARFGVGKSVGGSVYETGFRMVAPDSGWSGVTRGIAILYSDEWGIGGVGLPCYGITGAADGGVGQWGTMLDGSKVSGGIITTIGATGPTIVIGTTPVTGGTTNGVIYSNGSTAQSSDSLVFDSGGYPVIKLGTNQYAKAGMEFF